MFKFDTDWNTSVASLVDLLDHQARLHGDRTAFAFLSDEDHSTQISFVELEQRARTIAAALQARVQRGDRALLLYPAGLEFVAAFFGCLYAGVLAVPVSYPKPRRPMPRLTAIAQDAGAKIVLTQEQTLSTLDLARTAPELQSLTWLPTDHLATDPAARWSDPAVGRDDLAFLQYTSGSTSVPKGVMVTHGNLLHNLEVIRQGFQLEPSETGVFWLPAYHDMGLIGAILTPLYIGGKSVLMSPTTFLQRPLRWIEAMSRYEANITGAPNFAYDLCARKAAAESPQHLDLRPWKLAFCGAEPISADTLDRFVDAFGPYGFRSDAYYPCYGLAESTLMVTGGDGPRRPTVLRLDADALAAHRVVPAEADDPATTRHLVGCGRPKLGQQVEIVDPATRQKAAAGQVGEIWIRGGSVAQGYWQRPVETAETFAAFLADGTAGPFLRSGDLGFVHEGELFVTGRVKDVIIVRGRNLYPQDIERTVEEAHPLLAGGQGAAFTVPGQDEEKLVVVQVAHRQNDDVDWLEVFRTIRKAVSDEHDVDLFAIVLIRQGSLPKTTSGKVQRYLCRDWYLHDQHKVVARWVNPAGQSVANGNGRHAGNGHAKLAIPPRGTATPVEVSLLAGQVENWLSDWMVRQAGIPREQFDRDRPFAEFGLDSLKAVELSQELEDSLGVKLTPVIAWNYPTPALMAAYLAREATGTAAAVAEPEAEGGLDFDQLLAEVESLTDAQAEAQAGDPPTG